MNAIKWLGIAVDALVLLTIGLSTYGALKWERATDKLLEQHESARLPQTLARYDVRQLNGLPAPVQRYFRAVLKDGQPIVAAVSVDRIGILHPAILGLFTLMDLRGCGAVAQGELMRFFAEAAWYPTALLPSHNMSWDPVDDKSARDTLVDGPLRLRLLFQFNDQGLIESVLAEARARTVGKNIVMTPWEGRWSNHQERDGMRVPTTGEVAWLAPEGRKVYWRGVITSLRFEYAR